jgi:Tol biopolymer transport system component
VTLNITATTARVSVDLDGSDGDRSNADGDSYFPATSADGRFVAFGSLANDLVGSDTNGYPDVFVRDRQLGTTTLVSIHSNGNQGDNDSGIIFEAEGYSGTIAINADGRFVAFESMATNLVNDDTNGLRDIFVHDRDADEDGVFDETGVGARSTVRVSVDFDPTDSDGDGANANGSSYNPSISGDGRFVAFESSAPDLVAGDTNGLRDIFVVDRDSASLATQRVSVDFDPTDSDEDGANADGSSYTPSISDDGRFVAFESWAPDLVADDTNGFSDIFVVDRDSVGPSTARVSVDTNPGDLDGGNADNDSYNPAISGDGRFVAFDSDASDLVADDTNFFSDVFEAPNAFFIP